MNIKYLITFEIVFVALLFISIFSPIQLSAQEATTIELDANNVRTTLLNLGDLWWDPYEGEAKYEVPKLEEGSSEEAKHSIFAGALWIGGIDENGTLKVAAQTYRQEGSDYFPGPYTEGVSGSEITETMMNYDRFWKVHSSTIDSFKNDFESSTGTLTPTQIHPSILYWAGRGNPHFSEFALHDDRDLAPFWDLDENGIYDPTQGDYPVLDSKVEGVYADQMIWWVFNDGYGNHTNSGGTPLGIEISTLAYAFKTEGHLDNATFYKYTLTNRSSLRLDSVSIGKWVDGDLGQFDDDFTACIPDKNMGIFYNGDSFDGVYNSPPIVGVQFREGIKVEMLNDQGNEELTELGMSAFKPYSGDFSIFGNPTDPEQYFNYLNGLWLEGSPMTFGGNGYGGEEITSFMFPDDPMLPLPNWSECSENNSPADRRFLMSMGPFTLKVNQSVDFSVGVYWVQPQIEDLICPSFDYITEVADEVESFFDDLLEEPTSIPINLVKANSLKISPNPCSNFCFIELVDQDFLNSNINLFNSEGKSVWKSDYSQGMETEKIEIPTHHLANGLYILRVENEKGLFTEKISILH